MSNPSGVCLCGCGGRTSIAPQTVAKFGHVKGEPVYYIRGHANRKAEKYVLEDRGHATPCWIWQLWTTHEGYGKITIELGRGRVGSQLAHRWMWERARGPIAKGLHLDHLCCQPSCVNPDHLEPVTPAVNARRSSTAKLDWPKVRQIRRRIAGGATHRELAEAHGVCVATISHIASGRNWRESADK